MEEADEFRVLSDAEIQLIEDHSERGLYGKMEIHRLLVTVRTQRAVLKTLFKLFHLDPLAVLVQADTIRKRTLQELKDIVRIDDIP